MTDEEFRKMALVLAGAVEGSHMGHADFRVGVLNTGKTKTRAKPGVFASLDSPKPGFAMVKLPLEIQDRVIAARPETFTAAKGEWGAAGCTYVRLADVTTTEMRPLLHAAWLIRSTKPSRLDASGTALKPAKVGKKAKGPSPAAIAAAEQRAKALEPGKGVKSIKRAEVG